MVFSKIRDRSSVWSIYSKTNRIKSKEGRLGKNRFRYFVKSLFLQNLTRIFQFPPF